MKSRNLVLAAAGLGLALTGLTPVMASAQTTGEVSAQAVHRKSAACASPSGQKINISWGDGNVTTTVYYNNHCNQARAIELEFVRENGERFNKCFVAPAKKKSSKEIDNSNPNKVSILSRSTCP
ncbi:hypothetical protein [Lentzea sp. NPDC003310]|uniref:hypothetical protein n=1 Tax=Lentzea sp. NPDC003310 TaxID=3154447 RepID=UPI0033B03262